MRNHKDEVIGVLQLINKKRRFEAVLDRPSMVEEEVFRFTSTDEALVGSLASQAAVAYQNAELIERIRTLFEEFVNAAVKAVEMRDPTTSGHSGRVAVLTVGLATKVDAVANGPLADVRLDRDQMEELRYASILHDFGKVAVPEKVLKKGKKLLGSELQTIELRVALQARALETAYLRRRMEAIDSRSLDAEGLAALETEYQQKRRELGRALEAIRLANEPRVVEERGVEALEASLALVASLPVREFDTQAEEQMLPVEFWGTGPLLSARERDALLIRRGSLTVEERENETWGINSHVQHTYEFLQKIPWTGEFRRIPEIAWAHHEKLDGSGYPRRLAGADEIPVQSRMMTISDIFDALRAWDRPYKRAVSPERALDILADDAERGKLDRALLTVFIESRVWESDDYLGLLHNSGFRRRNPGR
jgi:HD-GYP domain-containing protein (c-di-GMP phosphodiesterase class II)